MQHAKKRQTRDKGKCRQAVAGRAGYQTEGYWKRSLRGCGILMMRMLGNWPDPTKLFDEKAAPTHGEVFTPGHRACHLTKDIHQMKVSQGWPSYLEFWLSLFQIPAPSGLLTPKPTPTAAPITSKPIMTLTIMRLRLLICARQLQV